MQRYLAASGEQAHSGEQAYVEPVPVAQQWRRIALDGVRSAKTHLLGDKRDARIDRFMAATRFADVEAGIVQPSWQAPAPDPG